jgi:riboflavin biosynthesis pyrimidine reductase
VLRLWPAPSGSSLAEVDADGLESVYRYPEPLTAPYVRVNFLSTANGQVAADGRTAGLGSQADRVLLGRLRRLADVILVGAGTVRADNLRGARSPGDLKVQRRNRGQVDVPQIAVVTASADLDVASRFFTDTLVPPLILTVKAAPPANTARLAEAGAEVLVVGDERAEVEQILGALAERGLYRILCEAGPQLLGDLIAADAVAELCQTIAPLIGGGGQISSDLPHHLRAMNLATVLVDDSVLFLRYLRDRSAR